MIKKIISLTNALRMLFLVTSLGFVNTSYAVLIDLTLDSDKDPSGLTTGEMITYTVGITPASAITGYTLDIRFDDAELSFESSEQLVAFFGGAVAPPFTLDPASTPGVVGSSGLATSDSGRASIISPSDSEPVGSLFSLTFTVHNLISDDLDDLKIGILDVTADTINPPTGGERFTFDHDLVTSQIAAVPVPATAWLLGTGLIGLVTIIRKHDSS